MSVSKYESIMTETSVKIGRPSTYFWRCIITKPYDLVIFQHQPGSHSWFANMTEWISLSSVFGHVFLNITSWYHCILFKQYLPFYICYTTVVRTWDFSMSVTYIKVRSGNRNMWPILTHRHNKVSSIDDVNFNKDHVWVTGRKREISFI